MFKAKLKAVYQDLTQSEKLVADYILDHIDEIRTITSHQLAVNTHIGQSTIIRFSATTASGNCWRICRRSRGRIWYGKKFRSTNR